MYKKIPQDQKHKRLDNYLIYILKKTPKGLIYKLIRKGRIRVNAKRSKPHQKLEEGDVVTIPAGVQKTYERIKVSDSKQEKAINSIIFENSDLIVVNKPSGISSHSGTNVTFGIVETLRAARSDIKKLDLVHRLDRAASGCLVLSKKIDVLRYLQTNWSDYNIVQKDYLALLRGRFCPKTNVIEVRLAEERVQQIKRSVPKATGKYSKTKILEKSYFGEYTFVKLRLSTGRLHQIRAQASYLGHPLLGDEIYGDYELNRSLREKGLKRLFLHANRIGIADRKGAIVVEAPLPQELTKFLEGLTTAP